MRLFVLVVLALLVRRAVAWEPSVPAISVVLHESKDADGHRVQFRSDAKTLWNTPQWTPGGEGPPLSLEVATKIAMDAGLREVPKATGVEFGNIKLLRSVFDYPSGRVVTWFWVFTLSPVIDGHPDRHTAPIVKPARDIVILLDGKVIAPIPLKKI
jgi:hypothetical protein